MNEQSLINELMSHLSCLRITHDAELEKKYKSTSKIPKDLNLARFQWKCTGCFMFWTPFLVLKCVLSNWEAYLWDWVLVLWHTLLCTVDDSLGLIFGLNSFLPLLISFSILFAFSHHVVNLIFWKTTRGLNLDRLFLVCGLQVCIHASYSAYTLSLDQWSNFKVLGLRIVCSLKQGQVESLDGLDKKGFGRYQMNL